jgi:hypothetical protein
MFPTPPESYNPHERKAEKRARKKERMERKRLKQLKAGQSPKSTKKKSKNKNKPKKCAYLVRQRHETRRQYYTRYIRSAVWFKLRAKAIKRDNDKCVICDDDAFHVHHWIYHGVFGKEPVEWLSSLCERCHNKVHAEYSEELRIAQDHHDRLYLVQAYVIGKIQEELSYYMVDEEYLAIMGKGNA